MISCVLLLLGRLISAPLWGVVEGIYNNNCHKAIAPGYIQEMLDTLTQPGYVNGINKANKILYSITSKGRKLLKGWIAFVSAYS